MRGCCWRLRSHCLSSCLSQHTVRCTQAGLTGGLHLRQALWLALLRMIPRAGYRAGLPLYWPDMLVAALGSHWHVFR